MEALIHVYANWALPDGAGDSSPQPVGTLASNVVRNKELFSFSYSPEWLNSDHTQPIDPELQLYQGRQFSDTKNFRICWRLSPAYDLNPTTPAYGLHLNISESDNQLDFALALEVSDYFRVKPARARAILKEVQLSVSQWRDKARALGISRAEQEQLAQAFRYT